MCYNPFIYVFRKKNIMTSSEKLEKAFHDFCFAAPGEFIHRLYCEMVRLSQLASAGLSKCEQTHPFDSEAIQDELSAIIFQFEQRKESVLQRIHPPIQAIAREILDELILEARKVQISFHRRFELCDPKTDWEDEIKQWFHTCSRSYDGGQIVERILDAVSERTAQLIDRDIKVIHEYQVQSLSRLSDQKETFKGMEKRLSDAIEEPLKQLMHLRLENQRGKSLQQASEWVTNLQEVRENYFDQLLMKIDSVMRDVVDLEETNDRSSYLEIEGEIIFMENELELILSDIRGLRLLGESDKQFLSSRLEGLSDHASEIIHPFLPTSFKERICTIQNQVASVLASTQS